MAWRMTKDELKQNTSANRKKFIRQRISSETPIGLLAYDKKEPIAWCSVAPRESYQRLKGVKDLENVWSIACFYIKSEYRDKELIDQLIEEAQKYAKKNGAEFMEAYPVKPDSPSYRFMGLKHTFEKAGYEYKKMAGTRRHVMTLKLK